MCDGWERGRKGGKYLKQIDMLEDLVINGRVWTGFILLRDHRAEFCEHATQSSDLVK
jgi:hypothetical protein